MESSSKTPQERESHPVHSLESEAGGTVRVLGDTPTARNLDDYKSHLQARHSALSGPRWMRGLAVILTLGWLGGTFFWAMGPSALMHNLSRVPIANDNVLKDSIEHFVRISDDETAKRITDLSARRKSRRELEQVRYAVRNGRTFDVDKDSTKNWNDSEIDELLLFLEGQRVQPETLQSLYGLLAWLTQNYANDRERGERIKGLGRKILLDYRSATALKTLGSDLSIPTDTRLQEVVNAIKRVNDGAEEGPLTGDPQSDSSPPLELATALLNLGEPNERTDAKYAGGEEEFKAKCMRFSFSSDGLATLENTLYSENPEAVPSTKDSDELFKHFREACRSLADKDGTNFLLHRANMGTTGNKFKALLTKIDSRFLEELGKSIDKIRFSPVSNEADTQRLIGITEDFTNSYADENPDAIAILKKVEFAANRELVAYTQALEEALASDFKDSDRINNLVAARQIWDGQPKEIHEYLENIAKKLDFAYDVTVNVLPTLAEAVTDGVSISDREQRYEDSLSKLAQVIADMKIEVENGGLNYSLGKNTSGDQVDYIARLELTKDWLGRKSVQSFTFDEAPESKLLLQQVVLAFRLARQQIISQKLGNATDGLQPYAGQPLQLSEGTEPDVDDQARNFLSWVPIPIHGQELQKFLSELDAAKKRATSDFSCIVDGKPLLLFNGYHVFTALTGTREYIQSFGFSPIVHSGWLVQLDPNRTSREKSVDHLIELEKLLALERVLAKCKEKPENLPDELSALFQDGNGRPLTDYFAALANSATPGELADELSLDVLTKSSAYDVIKHFELFEAPPVNLDAVFDGLWSSWHYVLAKAGDDDTIWETLWPDQIRPWMPNLKHTRLTQAIVRQRLENVLQGAGSDAKVNE